MSNASVAIEQHVRQLIHDETARALAAALTPVVTEAAKAAAAETYRQMAANEAKNARLLFSPISSPDAQRRLIEASVRKSHEAREQFAFYAQEIRKTCLEMALRSMANMAWGEDFVDRAAEFEEFILWGRLSPQPAAETEGAGE